MSKSFRQKLQDEELVLAMGIAQARTVDIVMIAGACGFDSIWIDLEHTATSLETASMLCSVAIASGLAPLVRVPSHDHQYMTRVLDTGAQGVVVPHVDTVAEARHVVTTCKFPPLGQRSMIGPHPLTRYQAMGYRELAEFANRETVLSIMLETPAAIERADEIAAVDGLDMVLIGPVDLTAEMGIAGEFRDPRFLQAVDQVAKACRRRKKVFGIAGIKDTGMLAEFYALGLRFINVGNDTGFLMEAAQANQSRVRRIAAPASK